VKVVKEFDISKQKSESYLIILTESQEELARIFRVVVTPAPYHIRRLFAVVSAAEFVPETAPVDALVPSDGFAVVLEPTLSSLSIAVILVDIKGANYNNSRHNC
jgi:hypothetical protein